MSKKYLTETQVDLCVELVQKTPMYQSPAIYLDGGEEILKGYLQLRKRVKKDLPKWFKERYPENIKKLEEYIREAEESLEASEIHKRPITPKRN